jgi:excisionase family DNA binding protein
MDLDRVIKEIQELKALVFPSDYYMGIKTLAKYSNLSERKLRELIHHPLYPIPSYKIDGSIRVKKSEFDLWLKKFRSVSDGNTDLDKLVSDVMKDFHMA